MKWTDIEPGDRVLYRPYGHIGTVERIETHERDGHMRAGKAGLVHVPKTLVVDGVSVRDDTGRIHRVRLDDIVRKLDVVERLAELDDGRPGVDFYVRLGTYVNKTGASERARVLREAVPFEVGDRVEVVRIGVQPEVEGKRGTVEEVTAEAGGVRLSAPVLVRLDVGRLDRVRAFGVWELRKLDAIAALAGVKLGAFVREKRKRKWG